MYNSTSKVVVHIIAMVINSSGLRIHHEFLKGFPFTLFGVVRDPVSCFGCFKT